MGIPLRDGRLTAPLLTASAAGVHLGIPANTIKEWLKPGGDALPVIHSVRSYGPRLPFVALAEAQILRELRTAGLTMQQIRAGVARLREQTGDEYVLATNMIALDGGSLLYDAASKIAPEWVQAKDGRAAIRQVVEAVSKYVSYAADGYASRLVLRPYGSADVIIDPRFGFGQPVFGAGKVKVETVTDLFYGGGESVEDIADEYDLSTDQVEAVLRVTARRSRHRDAGA